MDEADLAVARFGDIAFQDSSVTMLDQLRPRLIATRNWFYAGRASRLELQKQSTVPIQTR